MTDLRHAEVDGASIAYVDTGASRPGATTLLLVHGFPLSHAMWREQVAGLAGDCRVVAPDLRGYGESTLGGWPRADEPPRLARYADDLAELIPRLDADGPVVYVGFSMGGYTAFPFFERHRSLIDGLVLMDTRAADDTDDARDTRLKMAEKIGEWGAGRVAELMRTKLFAPGTAEGIIDEVVAVIASSDTASIAASQRAMAARPDSTEGLGSIDLPTLVVCGAEDELTPAAEMRSIAEAIRGAEFVEVAGAGHMAPLERPDEVNVALRRFADSLT